MDESPLGNGQGRCHARDGRGARCTDPQDPHPTVEKDGELRLSHHTKESWWCTEAPTSLEQIEADAETDDRLRQLQKAGLWTPGLS